MPRTTPTGPAPAPHLLASTLLALLPGVVLVTAALLLVRAWRPDLTDRVAVRFDTTRPTRYRSLTGFLLALTVTIVVLALGGWLVALLGGRTALARRSAVGFAAGMSASGAALTVGPAEAHRGLADPSSAAVPTTAILVASGLGPVVAGPAVDVQRADRPLTVVSVDDAGTAAAVLARLVERERQPERGREGGAA
ncbi:hypothetical protein [Cellulosimicrobium cellulans]|uniref:hypothetical protein n=1 Tax=Cellulosimicrobium cellulans TaxID=1710 RepID=UPI00130DB6AC|nr:hypothetical protein [Cellulosimicrobium cellulans]